MAVLYFRELLVLVLADYSYYQLEILFKVLNISDFIIPAISLHFMLEFFHQTRPSKKLSLIVCYSISLSLWLNSFFESYYEPNTFSHIEFYLWISYIICNYVYGLIHLFQFKLVNMTVKSKRLYQITKYIYI